jgi:hypothetical protein
MTPPTVPVQLLVFAKRKEDLTKQEFDDYWRGPHAKKFLEFEIVKKHCIRYEQVCARIPFKCEVINIIHSTMTTPPHEPMARVHLDFHILDGTE